MRFLDKADQAKKSPKKVKFEHLLDDDEDESRVNLKSPQDFSQYAEQTETKKKINGNDAVTIGDIETVKNEEISAPH